MIHAIRTVTVGDNESIIDKPIILYRGDREVEIEFTLLGNEFRFSDDGNVIKSANASHGQLVLNTPSGENMFSEVSKCHDGNVVFIITKEMIDEFIEVGFYSFQIRLYDSVEMKSRVTIPPVMNGFDIRNPIAAEDETNVVDQGIVDYARIFKDQSNEELPTFTWDGEYVKTEWAHHDVITENKLNKIEDALYSINANIKESDVVMLNTLDNVKKDADKYVKEHMAEVEADVDEFERNLNTDVQQFKIDTNAAMTAHKNEVKADIDIFKQTTTTNVNNTIERMLDSRREIDVLNPPPSTGLLPYVMGGDVSENTRRIQAIFSYVASEQYSYKAEGMSIYTGYTYTVKFPTGTYVFDAQINCGGSYLTIEGSRAIIQTTHKDKTFYFASGAGWNVTIQGFTFDRVYDAIWFDYYNLEMGSTRIYDCWFIDVENEAIHIDKQSQIGVVRDCKFHKCGYVLYCKSVDRMIVEDNWISEKPRWKNKDASIIARGMRLIYRNNLWVPYSVVSGVSEAACINAYGTVKVTDSHFGGEPGSKPVINVMEGCSTSGSGGNPTLKVIEVSNCDVFYTAASYTAIRLFDLPSNLIVRENLGFADNTVVAKWGNGVDQEAIIEANKSYCQIDISLNNGFQIQAKNLDIIPDNLKRFLYDYGEYNRKNGNVKYTRTGNKTFLINTNYKKKYIFNKTYILRAHSNPNPSGSGMYHASMCCIISFNTVYTDGTVKTNIFVDELYNHKGGTMAADKCDYSIVFEETGTTQLVTTGNINDTQMVDLLFTWNNGSDTSIVYVDVKELFDGALTIF